MVDTLEIENVSVGHGDCYVIKWKAAGYPAYKIMIDGGPNLADNIFNNVTKSIGKDGAEIPSVDLLILTHVDADHIDGLIKIVDHVNVKSYWGPCLPAFERHAWLFPSRVMSGINKARILEDKLKHVVDIKYPLEGHSVKSPDGRLKITVLSPPARLIERLLLDSDTQDLFTTFPMPQTWLLTGDRTTPQEETAGIGELRGLLSRTSILSPNDLTSIRPSSSTISDVASLQDEWGSSFGIDPEFFGNPVLNDTSLVILVEARTDGNHVHRILFTGDLENWTYLAGRYPNGLGCDIVKAPHHGGRVYLEDKTPRFDEVYQWLRPRMVLVSANGKHGLPWVQFREAVLRWGGVLFCPNRRGREILTGDKDTETCCFHKFGCTKPTDNRPSIRVELSSSSNVVHDAACASGASFSPLPVIQVRQHIIEPSNITSRLTEGELDNHTRWIAKWLDEIHIERRKAGFDPEAGPVQVRDLRTKSLSAGRHRLAADLEAVLSHALRTNAFWADTSFRYRRDESGLYRIANKAEFRDIENWLSQRIAIMLPFDKKKWSGGYGVDELLGATDTTTLSYLFSRDFGYPVAMFSEAIWPAMTNYFKNIHGFLSIGDTWGKLSVLALSGHEKFDLVMSEFDNLLGTREVIERVFNRKPTAMSKEVRDFYASYKKEYGCIDYYRSHVKLPDWLLNVVIAGVWKEGNVFCDGSNRRRNSLDPWHYQWDRDFPIVW